ncbi:GAF domain-containing sensor histidine kinase [Candidatus Leptofilum sp.]|uniref:sensor histidine kinase n=1 Tax=Candidatus Leptofilum sp. TaxID=3241576 RepID=UPI003B59AC58
MTLTQQFLILLTLPLSFIGMIVYLWRARLKRRPLFLRWSLTLLSAAVWASSVIRFFGGNNFSVDLIYSWGVVGNYALSLTAVLLLYTTFTFLPTPRGFGRIGLALSLLLWGLSIPLDPNIWPNAFPDFILLGQSIRQFDIWASVWITSWVLPAVATWMLTQKLNSNLPPSLFRNQVQYWLVVVLLLAIGSSLGSVQQLGQTGWQQAGVLVMMLAALTGTISLASTTLPDLQLSLRQLLSRIVSGLIVFGLTWGAITLLVRAVRNLPENTPQNGEILLLLVAAALFVGLFTLVSRFITGLSRRIFLPGTLGREAVTEEFSNAVGNLPEPVQLGQLFLRLVQANLATDEAWLFTTDDGPAGRLVLRPLATLDNRTLQPLPLSKSSPVNQFLRQNHVPLVQYDIDTLEKFADMPEAERMLLESWGRVLYKPLHAGDSLIGVLALGLKTSGGTYDQPDYDLLDKMARQISPLLAQAQNITSLRQINEYVFQKNQTLTRDKQHLQELVALYSQFVDLISPELRRPFNTLTREVQQLQTKEDATTMKLASQIDQQISEIKLPIEKLINISSRIQMRNAFNFQVVQLDEIAQQVVRNLRAMAEARRVVVEFTTTTSHTTVLGDEDQLSEAVQHVLHNAIKFNKIGGVVQVECGLVGSDLFLRVVDTGVGIPPERLEEIWSGLAKLKANGNGRSAGMGLALTKFIVSAHGGRVDAQSKYGAGSVFTIYLPLHFED